MAPALPHGSRLGSPAARPGRRAARAICPRRRGQGARSEAHLDDGFAADLRQPLLEPRLVLLLVQDVANLVAGLRELLARQRLLGVELEEVIADLGPEGR